MGSGGSAGQVEGEVRAGDGRGAEGAAPGLAFLLRGWRGRAGGTLGLGKPLPQVEVAGAVRMSERWYRDLERGTLPRLDPRVLDPLADVLLLDADERATLYLHACGGTPYTAGPTTTGGPGRAAAHDERGVLQELADRQQPWAACVTDLRWNVLTRNAVFTTWFPWAAAPEANLLRWALTSEEARTHLVDWDRHAPSLLAMIRFALAEHPGDTGLLALLAEVLRVPECRRLWGERVCTVAHHDGHRFTLHLPHVAAEPFDVHTQVLLPAGRQGTRFIVLH
ncbi:helix-turn-helix transcriptional regulator [Streptomyces albidoflavus]